MRALLVTLTVVEVVVFLAALVFFILRITSSLRSISLYLGKVAFGVRAIESQTAPVGPSVMRINEQLRSIAGALGNLADRAGDLPSSDGPPRRARKGSRKGS